MKINDILNESDGIEKQIELIELIESTSYYKTYLKPYLIDIKANYKKGIIDFRTIINDKILIFHGTDKILSNGSMISFKQRNGSKHTASFIHNMVNKMTKEKYGLPLRNGMFVTPSVGQAEIYGNAKILIPTGDYQIFFNPNVNDFTDNLSVGNSKDLNPFNIYLNLIPNLINNISYNMAHYRPVNVNRILKNNNTSTVYDIFDVESDLSTFIDYFKEVKSMKELYQYISVNVSKYINSIIEFQADEITNVFDMFLTQEINELKKNISQYVSNFKHTKNISDVESVEAVMWFDNAIVLNIKYSPDTWKLFSDMIDRV